MVVLEGHGVLEGDRLVGGGVVDATGAGDAYRAAFAVATAEGKPVGTALREVSRPKLRETPSTP
eukprot:2538189-Amphidinium_carterae.1